MEHEALIGAVGRRRTLRVFALLAGTLAVLVAGVPVARADTPRQLSVGWPAPSQPPSLNPQPPVVDTQPYMQAASISYDYATGTVTATMGFYDPGYWQTAPQGEPWSDYGIEIDLATDCQDGQGSGTDLSVTMQPVDSDEDGGSPDFNTANGWATLTGYEGQVQGTGSFDGTNYTLTVQSPYFVGRDFRCANFSPMNGSSSGWGYLDGWAPTTLTSQSATAAFAALLPNGAQIPRREGRFCPEALTNGPHGETWSVCIAEYKLGGRWYMTQGQAVQTTLTPKATIQYRASWTRRWARCSLRAWKLPGTLTSNNNCGKGAPQSDGYFVAIEMWEGGSPPSGHLGQWRYVGWQFTDSAGFGPLGSYACHRRGATATCTTRLGDSFRYTP
jgi:hypothetical protein